MAPPVADQTAAVDDFIHRQVRRAASHVKATDMFAGVLVLLGAALVYLLVLAIVDAWIVQLGTTARVAAFGGLVAGGAALAAWWFGPLVRRAINPVYSAKVIESAEPTWRNGLINYLTLRREKTATLSPAILAAMGDAAAKNLARVNVESTVDRMPLIRVAIALTAIVAIAAIYKVASPKDPVQTVARVLAPWSDIAEPSQVRITDVEPGNAEVSFGESVEVSATVLGRHRPSDVRLVITTDDQRVAAAVVSMTPDAIGNRYRAFLATGDEGVQQSLTYEVVAGDGRAGPFRVNVQAAPILTIQSLTYRPPAYTQLPERTVEGRSEIEGLEGTRVAIVAEASQPIETAYIELLAPGGDITQIQQSGSAIPADGLVLRDTMALRADGRTAHGELLLELASDRQTPRYTHYRLRMSSLAGRRGLPSAPYPIRVIADLPPEVRILRPADVVSRWPADRPLRIEIEATDPDFGITSLRIAADRNGRRLVDEALPFEADDAGVFANAVYEVVPTALGLAPGDEVTLFAAAHDSRTEPRTGAPDPNIARTDTYVIEITAPTAGEERASDGATDDAQSHQGNADLGAAGADRTDGDNHASGDPAAQGDRGNSGQSGAADSADSDSASGERSAGGDQSNPEEGDRQQREPTESTNPPRDADSGQGQASDSQSGDPSSGGQSNQSPPASGSESAAESQQSNSGAGDRSSDQPRRDGTSSGNQPQDSSSSDPKSTASDSANSAASSEPSQSSGDGQPQSNDSQDNSSQSDSLSNDAHDGEVFERLINRSQSPPPDNGSTQEAGADSPPSDSQQQAGSQQPGSQQQSGAQQQTGSQPPSASQPKGSQPSAGDPSANQPQSGEPSSSQPQGAAPQNPNASEQQSSSSAGAKQGDKSSAAQSGSQGQPSDSSGQQQQPQSGGAQQSGDEPSGQSQSQSGSQGQGDQSQQPDAAKQADSGGAMNGQSKSDAGQQAPQATKGSQSSGAQDKNANPTGSGGQSSESQSDPSQQKSQGGGSANAQGGDSSKQDEGDQQEQQRPGGGGGEQSDQKAGGGGGEEEQNSAGASGGDSSKMDGGSKVGPSSKGGASGDQGASSADAANPGQSQSSDGSSASGSQSSGNPLRQGQPNGSSDSSGNAMEVPGQGPPPDAAELRPGNSQMPPTLEGNSQRQPDGTAGKGSAANPGAQGADGSATDGMSEGAGDGVPQGDGQDQSGKAGADGRGNGRAGNMPGGGWREGDSAALPPADEVDAAADAANLEYTRRATDLALQYLEDQQTNPDPRLLEQLNWTREELDEFLRRWREMKERAATGDPAAEQTYERALRSLGLRAPTTGERRVDVRTDERATLSEDAAVTPPPSQYAEPFRAFQKSRNRAERK